MATGRGRDSATVVWVCLSVLSQTPTWFNTVGMGGIVLIKCGALNRTLDSDLTGSSQLTNQKCFTHSFCVFRDGRGYVRPPVLRSGEQSSTNQGRPSALWFPVQANIGHAHTQLFCYALMALVNPSTTGRDNPPSKREASPQNTFKLITASLSCSSSGTVNHFYKLLPNCQERARQLLLASIHTYSWNEGENKWQIEEKVQCKLIMMSSGACGHRSLTPSIIMFHSKREMSILLAPVANFCLCVVCLSLTSNYRGEKSFTLHTSATNDYRHPCSFFPQMINE